MLRDTPAVARSKQVAQRGKCYVVANSLRSTEIRSETVLRRSKPFAGSECQIPYPDTATLRSTLLRETVAAWLHACKEKWTKPELVKSRNGQLQKWSENVKTDTHPLWQLCYLSKYVLFKLPASMCTFEQIFQMSSVVFSVCGKHWAEIAQKYNNLLGTIRKDILQKFCTYLETFMETYSRTQTPITIQKCWLYPASKVKNELK